MSRKLRTAIVFAIAVVFAAAPVVLAQTPGAGSTTSGPMAPGATGTPSSQMGTMGTDTINATVADVNQQQNTLKLRMQPGGETVEFKVPQASLSNLNKGDSVQVSIRKAEAKSDMGAGAPKSRPESGTPGAGTPDSGTKSR